MKKIKKDLFNYFAQLHIPYKIKNIYTLDEVLL